MTEKLDNPVWYSLSETHKQFAVVYKHLKFYTPDLCPFGGVDANGDMVDEIDEYAKLTDNFFIVGKKPSFSNQIVLKNELVCLQMVAENKMHLNMTAAITRLNDQFKDQLLDLVNLVQPGYFRRHTVMMGDYYGIFQNDMLVAVSGERMRMNHFTEVSAVVTHPLHTGKGYAKQLVAFTANKIFDQGRIPFLHVAESNVGAIQLYQTLRFKTRTKISFWNLVKA
jgi:ribosomal protein S18 acetylase RimI-like enzyme